MQMNQCRCGVLFLSVQAITRFKNRVVAAKRSIFGPGFPSFSRFFEAPAAVVIDEQHDVDDSKWLDSIFEDSSCIMSEYSEEQQQQPATQSLSPAVPLIPEEESPDCTYNPYNQTSTPLSDLVGYTSSPNNKWDLSVLEGIDPSEVDFEMRLPEILDEPADVEMSTTTAATTTTTRSFNTHNYYGSETAPRVDGTTAYYGLTYRKYVHGSSVQNYDLMSQMLMRDEGFQGSQIITPPGPRRWCILKLIVCAWKRLRFARFTLLSVRGASQSLVTTACQQGRKRKWVDFKGIRCRKKETHKKWVTEMRLTTTINGPDGGKVWLGSYVTPEQAARANDVGSMYCSKASKGFNFSESPSILAPYKDRINQLPIGKKKIAIQNIARQYGEKGVINADHCLFGRP